MAAAILLLLVLGLVLFLLAGFGVSGGRFNLVALGLACWIATLIPGLIR